MVLTTSRFFLQKVLRKNGHTTSTLLNQEASSGGALRGIVLDLRDNPGGLLEEAVRVSDRFLTEGMIVLAGREVLRFPIHPDQIWPPNGSSSSGSGGESVAASQSASHLANISESEREKWSRRESNPRPKVHSQRNLRA